MRACKFAVMVVVVMVASRPGLAAEPADGNCICTLALIDPSEVGSVVTLLPVVEPSEADQRLSGTLTAEQFFTENAPVPPSTDCAGYCECAHGCREAIGDCVNGCLDCLDPYYQMTRITGRVNWVYMRRSRPQNIPIFRSPSDAPLLSGADFGFGPRPGIDASLMYELSCDYGLDIRYLWVDDFRAETAFAVPAGASHTITTPPSYFNGPTSAPATFRYVSKLQTSEVSLRRHFRWFDAQYGFRFADFHEAMTGVYPVGSSTETNAWGDVRNNLYGLQLGVDALIWQSHHGISIDGFGKAGIYYNDVHTQFLRQPSPAYSSAATQRSAFLGELGVNAAYQVASHLAVRGGYQLLWLAGVAEAANQVPATGNFNVAGRIPARVDTGSVVFCQGVNAGLEITW